jgi:hypothetical protein
MPQRQRQLALIFYGFNPCEHGFRIRDCDECGKYYSFYWYIGIFTIVLFIGMTILLAVWVVTHHTVSGKS